ncbi:MgtC/SapB family protein [Caulobacter sp.]|uniref:MgtC/SapB family protein n=1 Tax=Caulobacter sp. TaxID=78 RepID=UPI002B49DDA7|nr:MgtC/SapB family protein [Caulobacter sp.]HJV41806.1 MgtC/SapB family protein [Caulobacter sp.]
MSEWIQALSPFAGVGLAFALGLLIGVERGWSHRLEPDGSRVAGIRTFALLGLAGGVAGEATARVSPLIGGALLIAAAAALLIGYARAAAKDDLSATTTVVGIITLGLGALAAAGQWTLACVLAAITTLTLAQRKQLHEWVEGLSELELQAIVRFALISLAVLPLLPDREFGPMDAWNPREIWMVVVLVSGLSLIGYAASRKLGAEQGVLATAGVGAVVSSTAVTAAMAARIRKSDGEARVLVAGIALASTVMVARVLVLVAVLAPFALTAFALVAIPAGLVGAAYVGWALRAPSASASDSPTPSVRNPFDLGPALLLAGLVMVISLAGRWAMQAFGHAGLATVLGISGMVDVDAAIIAMSRLPDGSLTPKVAGLILAAPILANTLVKAGLAFTIVRGAAGVRAAAPLLLTFVAGLAGVAALAVVF